MKKSEARKKLEEIEMQMHIESRQEDLHRARSITVGTLFGGTTEVMLRGDGGKHLWVVMQPVEVTELIHQLAANIGCHVALKPRNDFASWREWRISQAEKEHLNGHAPFVNDMAVFQQLGASNFNQAEAEMTMNEWLKQEDYEYVNGAAKIKDKKLLKQQIESLSSEQYENQKDVSRDAETMAAKKAINKRKTK